MHSPFSFDSLFFRPGAFGIESKTASFALQSEVDSLRLLYGNGRRGRGTLAHPESNLLTPLLIDGIPIGCRELHPSHTGMMFGLFLQFMNMWLDHHRPRHGRHGIGRSHHRIERNYIYERDAPSAIPGSKLGGKLVQAADHVARRMNRTGRCAEGVQRALQAIGMPEFRGSGHAWSMLGPLLKSGRFEMIPASQVTAGDIMLRRRPGDYGHIAVITRRDSRGNLIEASDHFASVRLDNPRYDRTVFLRLKLA